MDCPEENVLVDFLRGVLDDGARDEMDAHLDGCEACRAVMVELARFEPESAELAITDQSLAPEVPIGEPTRDPSHETYKVAPRLDEGNKLGRYVVLNKVGEGGMGVVYAAYDPELDRKVAIKLLMTSLGGSLDAELAEQRTRLLREAQAMAKLSHPNVITVHDVGEFRDQVFVAMEFIDGGTLTDWCKQSRSWRETMAVFLAAGQGLAAAHRAGLVHRDFKPDNVLLDSDGRAVVTDFGLARPAAGRTDAFNTIKVIESTPVMSAQLTRTGALVGTPAYMAPEQLAGERSDALADQFSFCVTLYEGLFGHRPFEGRVLGELMANVTGGRILPPPRDVAVPRRVRRAVIRGLSVRPDERFETMEALIAELSRDPVRTWRRWTTVILPSAVLGIGLVAYQNPDRSKDAFCEDIDSHLRGIWDADRKGSLRAAFLATAKPYAEASWEKTETSLNDYARDWLESQQGACEQASEGTLPQSVMALRMSCLEQRRRELSTLVSVLQDVDGNSLERVRDVTTLLRAPSICDDIDALARLDASLDTPEKRELRVELDALDTQAMALMKTGKFDEALQVARDALDRSRANEHTWNEAESLIIMAEIREQQGGYGDAEALQHEAMSAALAAGHHDVVARVAIGRVWSGSDAGSDLEEAERWYHHGLAAIKRLGDSPARRVQIENGMAVALMSHDALEDAEEHIQRALDASANVPETGPVNEDATWGNLGRLYALQGRYREAADALRKSLELTEARYGASHPFMTDALENMGAVLGDQGDHLGSRDYLTRALELRRMTLGDGHPANATSLFNLANVDRHLGDYTQARAKLEEALEILRESHARPADIADILLRIGDVQRSIGDLASATASHRAAVELVEPLEGMSPVARARFIGGLGRTLVEAGQYDEGRAHLNRSLELISELPIDDPTGAMLRLWWATSFPRGVPTSQRAAVEAAVSAVVDGDKPLQVADALMLWAKVRWANGDRTGAHEQERAARELLEGLGKEGELYLRTLDAWVETHPPSGA